MSSPNPFSKPQIRWLLGVLVLIWLVTTMLLAVLIAVGGVVISAENPVLEDPILIPVVYLLLFGGGSLWLLGNYRQRGVDVRSLLGPIPAPAVWGVALALWFTVFIFSLGAFQVSYVLLSLLVPSYVEATLGQSIFLGQGETILPGLYNTLMLGLLVIAAPVLEEFLFRGALIHRWGSRWNGAAAVILSSLIFGLLHANLLGLTCFGLVMALLYLQTRSLWLVIGIHAINNAIAAILERITAWMAPEATLTLAEFQQGWWVGLLLMVVATPVLAQFIRRQWHLTAQPLPYFVNQDGENQDGNQEALR
ncbi:CPBP family intramembrane glutamic endopeptidase [Leptolyngbya sp. PCC 6406]|uniref:CPBP family intramembrane glutamic endopeptidase n=1 Tax=Leptolyngbya sp. PCC 6406 TaxID=1173264 RepID=UPI0002AC035B|nr:type II CAAX endopeptidase family protein [Leptolyngbya sp. PCC 6406]